jgi:hypothetical protein
MFGWTIRQKIYVELQGNISLRNTGSLVKSMVLVRLESQIHVLRPRKTGNAF